MPEPTLYANLAAPTMASRIIPLMVILAIRDTIRKGIALRRAWKSKQLTRFVFLFIFNTAWILPILYLIFRQKKSK